MPQEIERKFLVTNNSFVKESYKNTTIKQGYLNSDKERSVRIRVKDQKGFITIKGLSNKSGTTRKEWEYEIDLKEAEELLQICESEIIEKKRYYIKNDSLVFEVDVFCNENEGLVLAEIELEDEDQTFYKPEWLGKEVTGNIKYYNSYLSKQPFKNWK